MDEASLAKFFKNIEVQREQIEGIQLVPPRSPRKIFIWLEQGVNLYQYCVNDSFRIGPGVKTSIIKPMDRTEVEVLLKGLNINTPDSSVLHYLSHFGRIVKEEVVYMKNKDGLFAGLKNGDRKYLVDFSNGRNLDSFHLIDGVRVTVSYPGQRRTCGRCHLTGSNCPGSGLAKECEENGGRKIDLRHHMENLWRSIG